MIKTEGGGVNVFGQSSKGKTTLLQVAASVWGCGATPGFVRTWRATANGLEGEAALASDTCLILDELGMVDAREAMAAFYALANGAGKARAGRSGDLRASKTWRVVVLSSGELPVEAKLSEDRGRKPKAGQLVRMLDVPADRGKGYGAFDHGGTFGDAGQLAQAIKRAAVSAYGTLGPAFVEMIVRKGHDEVARHIRNAVDQFVAAIMPTGGDGQVQRAAQRFGLIAAAGEMAAGADLVPWGLGDADTAAQWAFHEWIKLRGGSDSAETRQAIEQVRRFIEAHGESRFENLDAAELRPVINRAGWLKGGGVDRVWMIPSETWKHEICAGHDPQFVARTLSSAGHMLRGSDGFQCVRKIGGANKKVYVVCANIFDGGELDDDA